MNYNLFAYPIKSVFDNLKIALENKQSSLDVPYSDIKVRITSSLLVFYYKGVKCVSCNNTATHFTIYYINSIPYLKLWIKNGNTYYEMTKDHIIPSDKGGVDKFNNLQPMCYKCNQEKDNDIIHDYYFKKSTMLNHYYTSYPHLKSKIKLISKNLFNGDCNVSINEHQNFISLVFKNTGKIFNTKRTPKYPQI